MYTSLMSCAMLLVFYFVMWPLIGNLPIIKNLYTGRCIVSLIIGTILGMLISIKAFDANNKTLGFILIGISIVGTYLIMFLLVPWLIHLIPERVRNIIRNVFRVARYILVALLVIGIIAFILFLLI